MRLFKCERAIADPTEQRFQVMVDLIKDLPRQDYNRFKKAMEQVYEGYATMRNVKTEDERETEEIDRIDKKLTRIKEAEEKGGKK